jgi:hypothetical protein
VTKDERRALRHKIAKTLAPKVSADKRYTPYIIEAFSRSLTLNELQTLEGLVKSA